MTRPRAGSGCVTALGVRAPSLQSRREAADSKALNRTKVRIMHPKRHSDASERRRLGFFEASMTGWAARSRGECPKFQLLKYNYSVFAGQSVAILGFKRSTFNNSTIWDTARETRRGWGK